MLKDGEKNNSLTVVRYVGSMIGSKAAAFLVRCDCGVEFVTKGSRFRTGDVKSCGCRKHQPAANRTHNQSRGSITYKSWLEMRGRCTRPTSPRYARYGGRGITYCERWESFENFLADMGPRPSRDHSLDRRNNDGNYEAANCRWATDTEQGRNKGNTKLTEGLVQEIKGRFEHGENQRSIAKRLGLWQGSVSAVIRGRIWKDVGGPVAYPPRRWSTDVRQRFRAAS